MQKKVLAIFSHPDDAEMMCAGTLSLLKKKGWKIHIATMAPGDKGTAEHTREEISAIRKAEGKKAAELIGGIYHCLEFEDVYIFYNRVTINAVTALVRNIRPSLVFTASPQDYMVDHEMTSMIVQTACFACGVKNMEVCEKPFEPVPYLYYSDPMEGKDKLGNPVNPDIYINISEEITVKEKMLACHESQRGWLLKHHKVDEYILAMIRFAEKKGERNRYKLCRRFQATFRAWVSPGKHPEGNTWHPDRNKIIYSN